jgi:prevent-host-death family protein
MRTVSVREARQALSHLERLLIEEDEVIITRRGKPVARLVRVQLMNPDPIEDLFALQNQIAVATGASADVR